MSNIKLGFIMTFIAGISTIFGIIPTMFKKKFEKTIISSSLAISAGVMLTISLTSLIPESAKTMGYIYNKLPAFLLVSIFIIIGIIISSKIDKKIENKINESSLYKLGIISTIVLILHNIPEGMTTFISTATNQALGIKLAFAIALHNIPEGISIAVPIYYSTKSRKKALIYTLIAGFSEFLGAIITYILFKGYLTPFLFSIILATTSGIMIDISISEFLPNSLQYKKNKVTTYFFVLGIIIMFLSEIFLF